MFSWTRVNLCTDTSPRSAFLAQYLAPGRLFTVEIQYLASENRSCTLTSSVKKNDYSTGCRMRSVCLCWTKTDSENAVTLKLLPRDYSLHYNEDYFVSFAFKASSRIRFVAVCVDFHHVNFKSPSLIKSQSDSVNKGTSRTSSVFIYICSQLFLPPCKQHVRQ